MHKASKVGVPFQKVFWGGLWRGAINNTPLLYPSEQLRSEVKELAGGGQYITHITKKLVTGSYLQASGPLDSKTQSWAVAHVAAGRITLVASLAGAEPGPGATD